MGQSQTRCCASSPEETAELQDLTTYTWSETALNGHAFDGEIVESQIIKPLWQKEAEAAEAAAKARLQAALEYEEMKRAEEVAQKKIEEAARERKKLEEEEAAKQKQSSATEVAVAPTTSKPRKTTAKEAVAPTNESEQQPIKVAAKEAPSKPAEKKSESVKRAVQATPKEVLPEKDPATLRHEVEVKLISAKGLRSGDWSPTNADPFCMCEVVGVGKGRFRTRQVSDKLNPVWNQASTVVLHHGDYLKITVRDRDQEKTAEELLGSTSMTFEELIKGFEGNLHLKGAATRDASVKVRVRVKKVLSADDAEA